ncbi:MAG TPA: phospholipase D-like domain-containing protein [Pyrinomonadaceae bacterium]|nr:phospholipase D-like domain-containing protein [Pyrinomonadaceae bacterium]
MTTELYQPEQEARERRDDTFDTGDFAPVRRVVEKAYARAAGSQLVPGNGVRLLVDAKENYPAWLEAIREARRTIHFESFIIHEDDVGREFAAALAEKAREGVRVRVVYDWLGAVGKTSRGFWRSLRDAGVEVKGFNPPRYDEPLGWFNRDHRKMISVDGRVGFVMGLCVGRDWVGRPEKGIEPWRDTGVEIRGPAVADMDAAFSRVWETACGEKIPEAELLSREEIGQGGDVAVRVIATEPNTVGLYRLEQLVAAGAREYLWLTDAYFVGTTMYVQALRAAAQDGVDVRLLVPSASDIPVVSALSRANYRALLEAGVRVFEWNGPMIHAKTSVVDGKWARVGSTNLNVASWMGNWELDVTVEDAGFAKQMEEMYCRDLEHATEIVISERRRVRPLGPPRPRKGRRQRTSRKGSTSRAAAGVIGVGSAVGAAITNRRVLGPAEARLMTTAGGILLGLSIIAVKWPRGITYPLAFMGTWIALALFIRAYKLRKGVGVARQGELCEPPPTRKDEVGRMKDEVEKVKAEG